MQFNPPDSLLVTVEGPSCLFTLNRPLVLNAMDRELSTALGDAIAAFSGDESLRVAVIRGAGGRAFSTGGDLREMDAQAVTDGAERRSGHTLPSAHLIPWYQQLNQCDKPVLAAIDGYCIAGGFELALCCDIRVATKSSAFGLPEPRRNLLAGPGLHHLARLIPLGEAYRIQLTGATMTAQRAYEIGLVQGLADGPEQLDEQVSQIVSDILRCAPRAVESIKHIVRAARDLPVASSWDLSTPYQERLLTSADTIEGARAFVERRAPRWTGN